MKRLSSYPMAILLTIALIALAIFLGHAKHTEEQVEMPPPVSSEPSTNTPPKLDLSLNTAQVSGFLLDDALVFSESTLSQLDLYNANWDKEYQAIVAVVTVHSLGDQQLHDLAWDYFDQAQLTERDALLLFSTTKEAAYLAPGDEFLPKWSNTDFSRLLTDTAQDLVRSGKYDEAALAIFSQLHSKLYEASTPSSGPTNTGQTVETSAGSPSFGGVLFILILLIFLFNFIDNRRYYRYHRLYGGMMMPPVLFRPILFWHAPGSRWYTRRAQAPPPPSSRNGGSGKNSRGGGFGGNSSSSYRGGGFGGSSSSRSRGSGFGGNSSSRSRGGGFGGSSGGSSRGGSFGGSSRGGGFGSRR